jgi:hypothetical protein
MTPRRAPGRRETTSGPPRDFNETKTTVSNHG